MPKEPSKTRAWEKERRNRLSEAFGALCKTLPCYNPSIPTSKIDILRNATTHIGDLQSKIKELITSSASSSAEKVKDEEFKNLQRRIKRLLSKHELLCNLLRDAKIPIPKGCGIIIKRYRHPLKWSSKLMPEQVKILQKKEAEKENEELQPRKFVQKAKNKIGIQNGTPKHRKAILNRTDTKKVKVVKRKKLKTGMPPKCLIVLSQPSITQPYYVITNTPSNILGNNIISSSGLVPNPVVSAKPTKSVSSISSLGPGTLILANGTIMPVLPQQTVLPVLRPPLILVPKTQTSKAVVSSTSTSTKNLLRLRPKYCLTKTTQINKVPIPALTSRYSNKDLICNNKVEPKVKKVKEQEKKIDTVIVEEKTDKVSNEAHKEKVVEEIEKGVETKEQTPQENCQKEAEPRVVISKEPSKIVEPEPSPKLPQLEDQQVTKKVIDDVDLNINHSELSNDIFASLQVPSGCQNPESTSPTAAFLLAFPLVSSLTGVKVTEVAEEDNTESQRETPTLLQIGTMDTTKPTQSERPTLSESLTPSLLNLDHLSFFSSKEMSGFYNSFEGVVTTSSVTPVVTKTYNPITSSVTGSASKNFVPFQSAVTTSPATTTAVTTVYNTSSTNCSFNGPKSTTTRVNAQVADKPNEKKINFQNQQQRHLIPELPTCFEQKNPPVVYDNISTENYHMKPKQQHPQQSSCNPVYPPIQKSFCNNLEVTKMTTYPIKSYPEPLYTNSNTSYSYSYSSDSNFNQGYYKNFTKPDNKAYYPLNYDNYSNFTSTAPTTTANTTATSNYYANSYKINTNHSSTKNKTAPNGRPPINWMTTPDKIQTDYSLPQLNRDNEFSTIYSSTSFTNPQTTYFNANPVYHEANNKTTFDLPLVPTVNSYQRNENEDNQFSWSPTKIPQFLEPPHNFVSSTLPTLVGDLALGNPLGFGEQKIDTTKNQKKENCRRLKGYEGNGQNPSNFLSVSQLVDHSKEVVPARTTTRRNSGNRSSSVKNKMVAAKPTQARKEKVENSGGFSNRTKNSYSAEALIGHQIQTGDQNHKSRNQSYPTNNKSLSVPPFLHDNIIPYFPSMDLPSQDNTYMQQNQNYHNFSNNAYSTNSFIPSTTTYNFMHDMSAPHDLTDNLFSSKNCHSNSKTLNNKITNKNNEQHCPPPSKKSKRKHSNDLPGFVDFPFLSMPGTINSPILPDDFHTHTTFLQPPTPQLYPCKNPFTKPNDLASASLLPIPPVGTSRTNVHNPPEISPSLNNAGTSFANFNLCTIIPEINAKAAIPEPYEELSRVKEQSRNYSSVAQVSFNSKSTLSSYINHTSSQAYNNQ